MGVEQLNGDGDAVQESRLLGLLTQAREADGAHLVHSCHLCRWVGREDRCPLCDRVMRSATLKTDWRDPVDFFEAVAFLASGWFGWEDDTDAR